MSYKAGDKFVIEIIEARQQDCVITGNMYVPTDCLDKLPRLVNGVDIACYNKGMEDAWALAQRIHNMNDGDVEDVFMPQGTPFYHDAETAIRKHTVYEAKEKLEAWDNKICFGDEVICQNDKRAIVTEIRNNNDVCILYENGKAAVALQGYLTKTGNNYAAELWELLGKIGGESE